MSKSLVQPIGQKRLTGIAIVRLKKHGVRFEIACYNNKVLYGRSRVEKDYDELLQSHTVYSNVWKGILTKKKDLVADFGTNDQSKICLEACEMEPGLSHDCDAVMRNLHGRLKVLGCFRAYGLNFFVFSKFICMYHENNFFACKYYIDLRCFIKCILHCALILFWCALCFIELFVRPCEYNRGKKLVS